jgi:hypothetical protein
MDVVDVRMEGAWYVRGMEEEGEENGDIYSRGKR